MFCKEYDSCGLHGGKGDCVLVGAMVKVGAMSRWDHRISGNFVLVGAIVKIVTNVLAGAMVKVGAMCWWGP